MNQMNQIATPCAERNFSVQSSRMVEALNDLENAVTNINSVFAPVLTAEAVTSPSEPLKNQCVGSSEYVLSMNEFVSRVKKATDNIKSINRRSEI